uniref:Putative secreted protein n=1 Tax=Ixodes ricinus TaxID=34613 RepID=A0A147BLC9_IXORI
MSDFCLAQPFLLAFRTTWSSTTLRHLNTSSLKEFRLVQTFATSTLSTTVSVATKATETTTLRRAYTHLQPLQQAQRVVSTATASMPPSAVSAVPL